MEDSEQIKKLLKQNLAVSEESAKILKKMHRAQSIGRFLALLKWIVILLFAMGAYYYIQPFAKTFWNTVDQLRSDFSKVSEEGVKGFWTEPR